MMTAIDMRQMSWGDSSRSGPWVKFALTDSDTLDQLKMNDGKCFKVFLVPVDDNGNPLQGEKAELQPEPAEQQKEPLKIEGMRASQYAAMMTQSENYWQFSGALNENEADLHLKASTGTTSKREFDWEQYAHQQLQYHVDRYIQWSKMRGSFPDHAIIRCD